MEDGGAFNPPLPQIGDRLGPFMLEASIAVPLTFWASFWGMNFEFLPYAKSELFFVAIAVMIASVIMTTWFLIHKGYWQN